MLGQFSFPLFLLAFPPIPRPNTHTGIISWFRTIHSSSDLPWTICMALGTLLLYCKLSTVNLHLISVWVEKKCWGDHTPNEGCAGLALAPVVKHEQLFWSEKCVAAVYYKDLYWALLACLARHICHAEVCFLPQMVLICLSAQPQPVLEPLTALVCLTDSFIHPFQTLQMTFLSKFFSFHWRQGTQLLPT